MMSQCVLPSDVTRTALRLYEGLGTPYSLKAAAMLREGDWDGISGLSPDPRAYNDARSYLLDAAAGSFLRKLQDLPTSHDRRGNAIAKWREGEHMCFVSNERLTRFLPEFRFSNLTEAEGRISGILSEVRKTIESWIGFGPPSILEGRFGPGATFSVKGGRTTVPDKIADIPSLTRGAIWFLPQWLGTQWGASVAQRHGKVSFVPGNRFTTVPKTSVTDRAIAAEPCINVFYQLALGRVMRTRLRKQAKWDLDKAQDIHGQVARESSVSREFATLDLSNASDTVCRNLVKILLPRLWFEALDGLRSPKTLLDGRWCVLEKFSSMGNGFTFELETIIFAALACVASRNAGYEGKLGKDVFVFGDDIIVKDGAVRNVKAVLEFSGFALNVDKSFYGDVAFRESCGQDFYNGVSVRPYFLKELPNGPEDYIALANGLRALGEKLAHFGLASHRSAWFSVLDCIPTGVRSCRGPKGLGDIVIHDDEVHWTVKVRSSIRYLRVFRPARKRLVNVHAFHDTVVLACATYGTASAHPQGWAWHSRGGVVPRDGVLSHKVGWTAYS